MVFQQPHKVAHLPLFRFQHKCSNLIKFPTKGLVQLKEKNYKKFKKRVLTILSMRNEEYFKRLNKPKEYIIVSPGKTIKLIKKNLNNLI